ncbi:hypothetical protein Pmar_PMAR010307, partial [Perkinsus marinus ATCC 50983]
ARGHSICVVLDCTKLARRGSSDGTARYCIAHGGGRRCRHPACQSAARNRLGYCQRHSGIAEASCSIFSAITTVNCDEILGGHSSGQRQHCGVIPTVQ